MTNQKDESEDFLRGNKKGKQNQATELFVTCMFGELSLKLFTKHHHGKVINYKLYVPNIGPVESMRN